MPKPCQICKGNEESDDVFVYNCCFNNEEVGCWGEVCDECAFRSNRPKWRGDRVCPPCWQEHVNAKNQTNVQAESTEESQPAQCPECEGIGEIFVERDKFDVTRKNARRHIAFGQGIHVCLGMNLERDTKPVLDAMVLVSTNINSVVE